MPELRRYLGQALLYALFFLPLAWVTHQPTYRSLEADTAVLKLAIRHPGKIVGECTDLSAGSNAALPANMRRPQLCPRERSPLDLELILDGEQLYRASVAAPGLHDDGIASMYQRFTLPAGRHRLELRMNDDVAVAGPTWTLAQEIELAPAQVMVASFKEGFVLE